VFGGRLLGPDGQVERSTGAYPSLASLAVDRMLGRASWLRPLLQGRSQRHYQGYDREREVDWVAGAYLWGRREARIALGGWDGDTLPLYYEDVDLCYRARKLGYPALYTPKSTIFHYRGRSPISERNRKTIMHKSLCAFSRKHYGRLAGWLMARTLALSANHIEEPAPPTN
jgi:GT2 family glycosyltransferase